MKIRWITGVLLMFVAASAPAQWGEAGPSLVFFDWGKEELSGDAKARLDQVADRFRKAPRPMTIDGHSDRSGSKHSNRASARQRASTVHDYLVQKGVPSSAMTIRTYGESWPLIATADGVREVHNRRVEIRWAAN